MVAAAVEREIGRRVEEALAALVAAEPDAEEEAQTARTCNRCGRELPDDRFEPNRRVCKSCRSQQVLESKRRAQADADGEVAETPFAGSTQAASPDSGQG